MAVALLCAIIERGGSNCVDGDQIELLGPKGSGSDYWKWSSGGRYAQDRGIRAHGQFSGAPGQPDARNAREILLSIVHDYPSTSCVIMVRDTDGQMARQIGVAQAVESGKWRFAVICGIAHRSVEAWLLAGFEAGSRKEKELARQARSQLNFDPFLQSERLILKADARKPFRNSKLLLDALIGNNTERKIDCAKNLSRLAQNGRNNGVSSFIEGLERWWTG